MPLFKPGFKLPLTAKYVSTCPNWAVVCPAPIDTRPSAAKGTPEYAGKVFRRPKLERVMRISASGAVLVAVS
jgi:hypothetical protein